MFYVDSMISAGRTHEPGEILRLMRRFMCRLVTVLWLLPIYVTQRVYACHRILLPLINLRQE